MWLAATNGFPLGFKRAEATRPASAAFAVIHGQAEISRRGRRGRDRTCTSSARARAYDGRACQPDRQRPLKEELPSTAPTASTATQDNGGGKTSSPSARLCSCQGTIAGPKKGPQRARSFTSVIDRACNMTQFTVTPSSNTGPMIMFDGFQCREQFARPTSPDLLQHGRSRNCGGRRG